MPLHERFRVFVLHPLGVLTSGVAAALGAASDSSGLGMINARKPSQGEGTPRHFKGRVFRSERSCPTSMSRYDDLSHYRIRESTTVRRNESTRAGAWVATGIPKHCQNISACVATEGVVSLTLDAPFVLRIEARKNPDPSGAIAGDG